MLEEITIFSDGSSLGNPGPGGFGVIMRWKDKEIKISEGFRKTTNNRMELLGPITALKKLKNPQNVLITTDSRYVIDGIEKGWAKKWKQNNWMRDKKNKALNSDLMGMVREDLGYDMARHVDSTVHMFDEWGLPMMKNEKTGRYLREGKWQIMIHGESYKPIVAEAAKKSAEIGRAHV